MGIHVDIDSAMVMQYKESPIICFGGAIIEATVILVDLSREVFFNETFLFLLILFNLFDFIFKINVDGAASGYMNDHSLFLEQFY